MKHINKKNLCTKVLLGVVGIILFVSCTIVNLHAQTVYSLETVPNVRLENRLNHVSNPDGILTEADVDSINRILNILEDSTGIQTAVVAITSVGKNDVRQFASDLFNHWGIGNKEDDNGLLILLVTLPEQRAVVFETGYGIEGSLPDATCFRIQQKYMLPDMKDGNYGLGMLKGVKAIARHLGGIEEKLSDTQTEDEGSWFYALILLLVALPFFILFVYLIPLAIMNFGIFLIQKLTRKLWPKVCPECGKRALRLEHEKITKWPTFRSLGTSEGYYVCKHCNHHKKISRQLPKISILGYFQSISGGGSHGGSGGSWGGGHSGGGGSISRF